MNLKRFINEANWPMVIYLSLMHILTLLSFSFLFSAKYQTLIAFPVWYWISGFGITAGAHRLWAHKSYKAIWPVRLFLMICNCCANQGSIFHWARDHRVHHKFSETPADPHDATRGFFYAHVGWLILKKSEKVKEAGRKLNLDDLKSDPIVMFQDKFDPWINLFFCFAVPTYVAVQGWGEDAITAFLLLGVARYVIILEATWMVNSVAHKFGYKPYDPSISPTENIWVALPALGEGWHNWHHAYPSDYSTSEFGIFERWNPTKLLIDLLALFGLAWDRKRSTGTWELAKSRVEAEFHAVSEKAGQTAMNSIDAVSSLSRSFPKTSDYRVI